MYLWQVIPLFPLAWQPAVGRVSCLSSSCPWHARSSMQKYLEKLKAIPFKLKVKSWCCSYSLELNRRHTKWNIGHIWAKKQQIIAETSEWEPGTVSDLCSQACHPGLSKRKASCHLPAQPPDPGAGGTAARRSLPSLVPTVSGSSSSRFAE